ncbi:MAG: phosphoribosyltransferase [Candidatus Heimdallarchaeota archaeon]|nr:phosphoribosyltransferase [Candidatus Heimdallarchaeota archaeon]
MPGNPETAVGAITVDGEKVLDAKLISMFEIDQDYIDHEITKEQAEAERREKLYRAGRSPLVLLDKTVILVDDGVATGSTMRVAIQSVRRQKAKKIVLVVPVAPREFIQEIAPDVEEIVCIQTPPDFVAVSAYYEEFDQVEDKEVVRLLKP